ncbi:MAG: hypothetical protein ACI363_00705 [Phocaeicola plebeius]
MVPTGRRRKWPDNRRGLASRPVPDRWSCSRQLLTSNRSQFSPGSLYIISPSSPLPI